MVDTTSDVSVIICAYTEERWEDIIAAVASLRAQTLPPREIILVSDHNDALLHHARTDLPGIIAIENRNARGLSGARNSGIATARGAFIAFLDDDAVAAPDWLERLVAWFADPQVLGVGGAVDPLWSDVRPQWFPHEFDWVVGCTYRGLPEQPAPVRNPFGGCCCVRRELFDAVGGFREGIGRIGKRPLGCEDTEIAIRARQALPGTIFMYEPRARIGHRVPAVRARRQYFLSRCYAEGLSKAHVSQLLGARDGLAAERSYTRRTLPRGVARGLHDSMRQRNLHGMVRAGAIVGGLAATTGGYAHGMLNQRFIAVDTAQPDGPTDFALPQPGNEPVQGGRTRVLMVTARYFPAMGGIETHVYEVAKRLVNAGADVTVLTTDPSGTLPVIEYADGVRIQRVRAWPTRRDYYFAPALYRIIMSGAYHIVHCQGFHTLVPPLSMLAARRAGIPFIVSSHTGGHSSRLRNAARGIQWAALRPLLARAARLVVVSDFEAAYFRRKLRLPEERFVVVRNGSYLPRSADVPVRAHDGPLILSVGRLERYKGHHRVIAALPTVLAQFPDARLQIIGAGPYEQQLHRMAARLGVADRTEIRAIPPGEREQMAALLGQADLVTLLSDYEAHPVSVMEALALGRSVLVADTSGLSELAQQGLVRAIPVRSTPDAVGRAILEQLRAPVIPTETRIPTWDDCADELFALYQSVTRGE
ncbi:MAG: glycosyltransferase [Chloroflexota bacterium]|nr:glycosyltransferase [Chloroflexota bacterium]